MKVRTPFDELAAAMAAHKDPLAKAMDAIDPVHLREFRRQQELLGPTKLPPRMEEAYKALKSAEGALGVNRTTAEAILGYKPGNAVMEAALGLSPGGAVMDAAAGRIRNSLQDEIDRATATVLRDDALYRSPARGVLDQIEAHTDIKPANRGRRVARPPAQVQPGNVAKDAVPINSVADIGRRVREVRLGMGMTQQRFADMAGVGRRFLIELEQGKASLEIGRVLAVCQAAGIKLAFAP